MAKRLGVDPDSISFNFKNKNYKDTSRDAILRQLRDFRFPMMMII